MSTKAVPLELMAQCLILAIGWPAAHADEQQALLVDTTDSSCCDEIVFASRNAPEDHHWYANFGYYARDSRGYTHSEKGQLCKLNLSTKELTVLIDDPEGGIRDPHVHYDGNKILFSWRRGNSKYHHLYEINVDGTGIRQLTDGPWDDIEPIYMPDGDIMFISSRCKRWVPCWATHVGVLFRCDKDGGSIRQLSPNVEHENTPWMLPDGRVLYMRWEYVDRSQSHFHHLWVTNPDGTEQMAFYGNMHPGDVYVDAKPIPGTHEILMINSPGHGRRSHQGRVAIVSAENGPDDMGKQTIINHDRQWRDPYPLSENTFLVAKDSRLFTMDAQGNAREIYKHSEWLHEPRPIRSRPRERVIPPKVNLHDSTGKLVLLDVYHGRNMKGVKRGDIKKLLILEQLPKPINFTGNSLMVVSYWGSFLINRVLGTVPVEPDGSAYMELPANRALFFVALDEDDLAVKRMQSFTTVMPGELTTCIGCHEGRTTAPDMSLIQALHRRASKPQPIAGMPEIIDYPRDIQPIWNKYCLDCHDVDNYAGRCQLHGDQGPMFTISYFELTRRFQMADGRNQARGNLAPRSIGSVASPLMNKVDGSHYDVKLDSRSLRLIKLWLDASATHPGTYAAMGSGLIGRFHESRANSNTHPDHKLPEVQQMRQVLGGRCRTCHPMSDCASDEGNINPTRVRYYNWQAPKQYPLPWIEDGQAPADYYEDVGTVRWMKKYMPEDFWYYRHIAFNLTQPEKSLALLAPLAKAAGGHGTCPDQFQDKKDPDYRTILAGIEATKKQLNELTRFNMKPYIPRPEYVREMKRFGILPQDHHPKTPVDPYELDRKYFESLWWKPIPD